MSIQDSAFEWTETNREWLIENPARIVAYVAVALIVRFVIHRAIDRATRPRTAGAEPGRGTALMRGLRSKSSSTERNAQIAARRAQRAATIGSVLKSTVSIVLLVWVVLSVLSVLGVNIAPFIASAGIVGLAIGFGAQNLVRDFVTGVFMLLEDEHGQVNLIVPPAVYERHRTIVRAEPLLLVHGRFERIERNRNVLVSSLESLAPLARRIAESTDVTASLPRAHHFGHR